MNRRLFVGEFLGTFLLVLFATTANGMFVLFDPRTIPGWFVPLVNGIGVAIAMFLMNPLSGAHLNPAVSLALAIWRPKTFSPHLLLGYWSSQLMGAFSAGLIVLTIFRSALVDFESRNGLVRGFPGSERAAMLLAQYFPNPVANEIGSRVPISMSHDVALLVEMVATIILLIVIFACTEPKPQSSGVQPFRNPLIVGFCVMTLNYLFGPLTQAGLNPARDLGPRLVAFLGGYGAIAIPGPQDGFVVYLVGPFLASILGGFLFERLKNLFWARRSTINTTVRSIYPERRTGGDCD